MYYVRHGQSEANVLGIWAGSQGDSPLTELGRQQALTAAEKLKEFKISRVISSTLGRAYHTAKIISEVINFEPAKIEVEPRLVEYHLGILSGLPKRKFLASELRDIPEAEDPDIFRARILSFLREISIPDHSQTLVVAHSGVQRMIETIRLGMEPSSFIEMVAIPNAEVVKYELDFLS